MFSTAKSLSSLTSISCFPLTGNERGKCGKVYIMLLKEKSCVLVHIFNLLGSKSLIEFGGIQSLIL